MHNKMFQLVRLQQNVSWNGKYLYTTSSLAANHQPPTEKRTYTVL
jgi:hypothetical protein